MNELWKGAKRVVTTALGAAYITAEKSKKTLGSLSKKGEKFMDDNNISLDSLKGGMMQGIERLTEAFQGSQTSESSVSFRELLDSVDSLSEEQREELMERLSSGKYDSSLDMSAYYDSEEDYSCGCGRDDCPDDCPDK